MSSVYPSFRSRVGCVILAAGGSTRLGGGQVKQLLRYRGKSLVRWAAETALEMVTGADAGDPAVVAVVLGHRAEECAAQLAGLAVRTVRAEQWSAGMGASLKAGLRAALAGDPALDALIVMLCDQPLVTAGDLRGLVAARDGGGREAPAIVAAEYPGGPGVPALFARATFPDLAALDDDAGAKGIIVRYHAAGRVACVPLPHAGTDVDTVEDFARLTGVSPR